MRRWLGGIALALALMPAAPGQAASFTLANPAQGGRPGVAVDVDGTGHFAWTEVVNGAPDVLHYCRVPRGATACQAEQAFVPDDKESFGPAQVLIPSPGRILVIQNRCCSDNTVLYESTDGGTTWSGPRTIGDIEPYESALGPGPYSVSLTDHVVTNGVDYQAAPIAGGHPGHADIGKGIGQTDSNHIEGYYGSTAFLDPVTPVVAFGDGDTVFFRIWGGTGDYNDISSWGPTQTVGPGDEPVLVSGTGGVYLLSLIGEPGESTYVAQRLDPLTHVFGPQVAVSEKGSPVNRDFFEDGSGRLEAAWETNYTDQLKYRYSDDGKAFSKPVVLDKSEGGKFNLRIATAPDGGGFATWDDNGVGPVHVAVIPVASSSSAGGGGGGDCPKTVAITPKAQALARIGCLKKQADGTYTSDQEVRVNGIDFQPSTSRRRGARSAAAPRVVIDPKKNQIRVEGAMDAKAGNVVLHTGALSWDLDKPTAFTGLDSFHVDLLGFPVVGQADVTFVNGGTQIHANLGLPGFFGGVTGQVVLHTEQSDPLGLKLDGLTIEVPEADVGALILRNLKVSFQSGFDTFEGQAELVFPPQKSAGIAVGFGFKDGKFIHAEATVGAPIPPFPLPLTAPPGPLFLQSVSLKVAAIDGLDVSGGAKFTAGPPVDGTGLLSLDGGFDFNFPASKDYADLSLSGTAKLLDAVQLASAYIKFRTTGLFQWGGSIDLDLPGGTGVIGVKANTDGFINLATGAFNATGDAHVCLPASCHITVLGADVSTPTQAAGAWVVSSNGAAGCASIGGVGVGAGVHWGDGFSVFADGGCDLGSYEATARRRQAGGATSFTLPGGMSQAGIQVKGASGVPAFTLTGPGGISIATDPRDPSLPVAGKGYVIYSAPKADTVFVIVGSPAGGRWTLTPKSGSPAIAGLQTARGLPPIAIHARVSGRGRRRVLTYSGAPAGEKVTFIERAGQVAQNIGVARTSHGALRFSPADGPGGRRSILALVENGGMPRGEPVVAHYTAPPPVRLGRPRFVRLRRHGSTLRISWGASTNAAGYAVRVRLRDGRVLQFTRTARQARRLAIPRARRGDHAQVTVRGVKRDGERGPSAQAVLRH